ncbi:MAG: amidohydrolase [Candidatus Nezhaarchaeales archaeon]
MKSLLVKDCSWVVTQNQEREVKRNTSILIEDGLISDIGDVKAEAEMVISGRKMVAIPGLVNAHTHAAMTLLRGYADDLPLKQWLEKWVWPLERKMRAEYCYSGALLGAIEMVKGGITAFLDMYLYPESTVAAALKVGLRAVVCYGMFDFGDQTLADKQLKEAAAFIRRVKGEGGKLVKPALGPHAPYTCSKELLIGAKELADKEGVLLHIHLAETADEQEEFKRKTGFREILFLDRIGFLGPNVVAAHCVHLSKRELQLLVKRKVKVVHCPVSNMKLSSGVAPLLNMVERGCLVTLGTDSAASNNSLDLFESMKVAALLHKAFNANPAVLPAQQVLDLATLNGYAALYGGGGSIAEGERADIVLLNLDTVNLTPVHSASSIISHLIYAAKPFNVSTVIVNGKLLVHNGRVLTVKEFEVLRQARKAALRLRVPSNLTR